MSEHANMPSGYKQPPSAILEVMHSPSPPVPVPSPTNDRMILVSRQRYPSIQHVATPYLRLAGTRVEPGNHNRRNTKGGHGIRSYASKYELLRIKDGTKITVAFPANARTTDPIWSADGKQFAFENITSDAVEIWIGDGHSGAIRRVPNVRLNPVLEGELQWMPDQKRLLVKLVPEGQGPPPPEPIVPWGPNIQESDGKKGQSSTYEARDTLNNKHDEALFDHYMASQPAFIDTDSLAIQPIGEVDRYVSLDASPDGKYLLVKAIRKPYSYLNAWPRFPYDIMIWNLSNHYEIIPLKIASNPLADRVPIRGVPVGPRNFSWRANAPATLIWAEALDGGDWGVEAKERDKIMLLQAPFNKEPVEIARTEYRFKDYKWGQDPTFAVLSEYDINRQWERSFIVNIDDPQQKPQLLVDISMKEKYSNPGNIVMHKISNGFKVIHQIGNNIFFAGPGSSRDGDRPFLDRLNLGTLKTTRLFRSSKLSYEKFLAFSDAEKQIFLSVRESPNEPPNVFQHTLQNTIDAPDGEATFTSEIVAVTHIPNPTPMVSRIGKRIVTYKRQDGIELSFNLHTPPGYKEGTPVPTILYAYPRDFADKSQAGQVSGSQATFTRIRKHQLLLLAGYAIIENAAFPIVGDPKTAYDTYIEQLVLNAEAAVTKAVELGVADPDRIGVTGHSHGALMTANLLAHSTLFRAGIATSGSYNKTLTPFGFQSERRTVWQAHDVYWNASTFFAADKLKLPILIVHGMDDANPGTTPLQSSNFYSAIRGNGGITKLVLLPHEPHWYEARESHEHLVHEMLAWFNTYIKNAPGAHVVAKV